MQSCCGMLPSSFKRQTANLSVISTEGWCRIGCRFSLDADIGELITDVHVYLELQGEIG